ncbi:MAG: Tim44-like domain-containing protein [Pseudomonadales bacterium]|uniref:Lipoprotein n=1 Tax=Oleiphilus messinensis TaxID=141451 RepID=A0A1Y0I5E1_9GAMM|nr:Tim44-like domain-containing protein [Oleiphilus messinensis]ARU55692.1 lipoprotein [Oleiphilus messinensis]MCG8609585.1 Tim44-like domain-containing protein [Pseudomonadales bacterium]
MKQVMVVGVVVIVVLALTAVEPAMAGPGGKIARAAFETFWGRIILGILVLVFLPLITYMAIREKLAERRARKDLRFMAGYSAIFDWLAVQARAKDCFYRVHSGWEQADLSGVSGWMTEWYWQNQQQVHLERWEKEGLVNVCKVKKIRNLKPLLFVHRNQGEAHQDSMVVISIEAHMQDYLMHKGTGKVVEGSKRFKDVETIWSFTLEDGVWKVSDIEEDSMSMVYTKMVSELPDIESTVLSDFRA